MPNLPSPYKMRNWKDVATKYDKLLYTTSATGQYLPLTRIRPNGINYPSLQPTLMDSYVGTIYAGNQAEAINIMPSVVGATLVGVDKSNQNGVDWVLKTKDFFNKLNGQNVYLNGFATTTGNDWWYDVMPNIFFYQLYSQYPGRADYDQQFISVADQWLKAVNAMGGATIPWTVPNMNYRAFNLSTLKGNTTSVPEPESAGTIAWLLYNAYKKTGKEKYLNGAQQSMEFLNGLATNPSYELQLPYGTLIAAKMNAEVGTHYDIQKMLGWSFDRGPLRGWGTIVGKWNGSDVSGLIGEANDGGDDYAFAMNGFQQAAALVPMVKYDKRFARAIAKWMVNLANASRFYYSKYLPSASQDDYTWSATNDPESVIGYEALKENSDGKKLYATGDAKRGGWAQTNLGIYGSSSVGYLAAVVDTTNVSGILKLDINRTDFFGQNVYPSYILYNPYAIAKQVIIDLGAQSYDIYDAISESTIKTSVTGNIIFDIPGDQVMLLVYLPQGSTPVAKNGKLYIGNNVVDYNSGYDFNAKLRIKVLSTPDSLVSFTANATIYSTIENPSGSLTYTWTVNGSPITATVPGNLTWTAPAIAGTYKVLLRVGNGTATVKDSVNIKVVDRVPVAPSITGFTSNKKFYYTADVATITCNATNSFGGTLQYIWAVSGGSIQSQTGAQLKWNVPAAEGSYNATCEVANSDNLKTTYTRQFLVRKMTSGTTQPFAYYPLDGNVLDATGNGHDGTLVGAQLVPDSQGDANRAYKFSTSSDVISIANSASMNFQTAITLAFWVKLDQVTQESFVLSHGSWEERWKVSITPDRKLRWTIKTNVTTTDLDSSFPLELNQFYHFTVVYTGYSMEIYADGMLDSFAVVTGAMATTAKIMTFGKKDLSESNYTLKGTLDEIRIYDKGISPNEIATFKTLFNPVIVTEVKNTENSTVLYPNPTKGAVYFSKGPELINSIEAFDVTGRKIYSAFSTSGNLIKIDFDSGINGMIIIKIETDKNTIFKKIIVKQ